MADVLRSELAPMRETVSVMEVLVSTCPALAEPLATLRDQMTQVAEIVDQMVDMAKSEPDRSPVPIDA